MWQRISQRTKMLPVIALVSLFAWILVSAAEETGPAEKGTGSTEGPLRLEMMVLLDNTPVTLLFRATNAGKVPVTVERFRHWENCPIVVRPDGVEVVCHYVVDYFQKPRPVTSMVLKPGTSKEWEFPSAGWSVCSKPGTYKIHWRVGKQTSEEMFLFRRHRLRRADNEAGS